MVHSLPQASIEALRSILCHSSNRLLRDQEKTLRLLHLYMLKTGLRSHKSIGNDIIPKLVSIGCIHDAHCVLDRLIYCNEMSWNFLITGYVECGLFECAFLMYHDMLKYEKDPSGHTLVALLKTCAEIGNIERGIEIHKEAERLGFLETNLFVGGALVDMYAKCGYLSHARNAFDKLRGQNVVTWTLLITRFIEHGESEAALQLFEQMQLEGINPNSITFMSALKACADLRAISKGKAMHAKIERHGLLERDAVTVGSTLVGMYGKCGMIDMARQVFEKLPSQNEVSWNALITGYFENGHGEEALKCYRHMQLENVSPDAITFMCMLKVCGDLKAICKGQEIHIETEKRGLSQSGTPVGNSLVEMYAKFGYFDFAKKVFDNLQSKDVVSWTLLLSRYVDHGYPEEAIKCFEQMQLEDILPNSVTLVCTMKACATSRAVIIGQKIHGDVERLGLLEKDDAIANTLIDMYARCKFYADANKMFDTRPIRNTISWNALLTGYTEHGYSKEVLSCFQHMQIEGIYPDAITLICSLNACGCVGAIGLGQEIHIAIEKQGLLKTNLTLGNALIHMYVKYGQFAIARKVFDDLACRDVVSWTTLISGFVEHGDGKEAIKYFDWMQQSGFSPDAATTVIVLKSCGSIKAINMGQKIHADIEKKGFIEEDPIIMNALVDMYVKCGSFDTAKGVFNKLLIQDVVSWTTLVSGYVEHGHSEEALMSFEHMKLCNIPANNVTLLCTLKAAASIRSAVEGKKIHDEIERQGLLEKDSDIGNTLVDMYAKCGMLDVAHRVFNRLRIQDVVSRTALMSGYAQVGASEKVFHCFKIMLEEGIKPNSVTFVIILGTCSCRGLFHESHSYFEAMTKDHGIIPTLEHHTCMVGILSRTGHLDKAMAMIKRMPDPPDHVTWHTILYASRNLGNIECGRQIFDHVRR